MDDAKLQEVHDFLIEVAQKAADLILAARPTTESSGAKKNSADVVTETDKAVEEMIYSNLHGKYPDFDFIGEETYTPGQRLSTKPTFIVDPIDGTSNFIHNNHYVCISLGFATNRQPTVGVILNPFTSTLYTAIRGHGAYVRHLGAPGTATAASPARAQRLPLRDPEPLGADLRTAVVAVEWGSDRSGNDMDVKARTYARLVRPLGEGGAMVHALRSLGSAALNLCGVAAGQLDAYWEAGGWAWDVAAGWCILTEAGGMMVDANPGGWEPELDGRRIFAVRNGGAAGVDGQRAFVEKFWSFVEGRCEVGIDS